MFCQKPIRGRRHVLAATAKHGPRPGHFFPRHTQLAPSAVSSPSSICASTEIGHSSAGRRRRREEAVGPPPPFLSCGRMRRRRRSRDISKYRWALCFNIASLDDVHVSGTNTPGLFALAGGRFGRSSQRFAGDRSTAGSATGEGSAGETGGAAPRPWECGLARDSDGPVVACKSWGLGLRASPERALPRIRLHVRECVAGAALTDLSRRYAGWRLGGRGRFHVRDVDGDLHRPSRCYADGRACSAVDAWQEASAVR